MLEYCDKCGHLWQKVEGRDEKYNICEICKNHLKMVPDRYFENPNFKVLLSKDMEQKLINDLVLTSPNFDQYYFDHKDEIKSQQDRELSIKMEHGKAVLEEKSRVPKCPSCGSTNISKIGVLNRAVSTYFLGLASGKIGKTHKCNNCGTMW